MLDKLRSVLSELPKLLYDPSIWQSLEINKRKPFTYRVWTILPNGLRVCLHKFDECSTHEAFDHPHPWPGAFIILHGSYRMRVGYSFNRVSDQQSVAEFNLEKYSSYAIVNPLTWHAVIPNEETYTIMINEEPFAPDIAHLEVRTTAGKDLDKMTDDELTLHLSIFKRLLADYFEAK